MSATPNTCPAEPASASAERLRCGTLQYTGATLAILFGWMLWGDFCFTLMEGVAPSILPLQVHALGASSFVLALIYPVIPQTLNFMMNPTISFRSDRFRSRWGRRIPFLAVATPFVTLALILLAFYPEIGTWLHGSAMGRMLGWSPTATMLLVIGVLNVFFQISNLFINTVFWYFFNDVVPQAFMGRFLGLFRVVGGLAGAGYSYFIYPHAMTHMREIFIGAAIVYFVSFSLMCWKVKEGEYPPPPENVGGEKGLLAAAKTYLTECFGHRIYRYYFFNNVCASLAGGVGVFGVFLNLSLGLDLKQLGLIGAVFTTAGLLLTYPAGYLADRYHPVRVFVPTQIVAWSLTPLGLIWLFRTFSPHVNYQIIFAMSALSFPAGVILGAMGFPLQMRVFPRERFGQFCSCNAMQQALASVVGGLSAGVFMDVMRRYFPDAKYGKDFCYRFIPVWQIVFLIMAAVFLLLFYREWKRLGGKHAQPPVSTGGACAAGEPAPAESPGPVIEEEKTAD